ncbi:hypothetical protein GOBAR_DD07787 [Gossypium barbadense]|nr:hypothetical protein GOBAR_DD07787 [Gossypium barbadense]
MEHVQEYPPPAAPSAYPPLATRVSVIEPEYCYPQPVDLAVVREVLTISEGKFAVSDINGNIMFKIKGKIFSIHDRRLLTDATGNPVCTLRHKWKEAGWKDPVSFIPESPTLFWLSIQRNKKLVEAKDVLNTYGKDAQEAQFESVLLGKDKFMVAVYPNVDYAFVVALIAILDGINHDDDE